MRAPSAPMAAEDAGTLPPSPPSPPSAAALQLPPPPPSVPSPSPASSSHPVGSSASPTMGICSFGSARFLARWGRRPRWLAPTAGEVGRPCASKASACRSSGSACSASALPPPCSSAACACLSSSRSEHTHVVNGSSCADSWLRESATRSWPDTVAAPDGDCTPSIVQTISVTAMVCVPPRPSLKVSFSYWSSTSRETCPAVLRRVMPCPPRSCSARGSSDSDSELYQSEASESTASLSAPRVSPAFIAAIFRRSFSAFSTLRLRVAMRSLRSSVSSCSSRIFSCASKLSAPSAVADSSEKRHLARHHEAGCCGPCASAREPQRSISGRHSIVNVREPRETLTMVTRRISWQGLLSSSGPNSSDGALIKKGSARLTIALRVTSCTSSLSCTLWMERVSR